MGLDDPQLLGGVEVPELNDAVELSGVQKRAVDGEGQDRLAVVGAQGHELLDVAVLALVGIGTAGATGGGAQPPQLDGAVAAAGYQDVVVGIDLDGGALGHEHAVDVAVVGKLADGAGANLQHGLGLGDQAPALLAAPRRARAADGLGVEEAVAPAVGVALRPGGDPGGGAAQADPLDGGVLGANVQRVELGAVGGAEDVADVVDAVDLVQVTQRLGAPDVDDGVAGAGEEQRGVGREEERQDAALVRLDLVLLVEGGERPGDDLAVLGADVDGAVAGAHGEGEDRVAVLEAVDQLGGALRAVGRLEGGEDGGGEVRLGRGGRGHRGGGRDCRAVSGGRGVLPMRLSHRAEESVRMEECREELRPLGEADNHAARQDDVGRIGGRG